MTKPLRNTALLFGVASGLAIHGCVSSTEPTVFAWEADIEAADTGGITGSIGVLSQFGRTEASIRIERATQGATYSWRISEGGCASDGALVGGTASYPDLAPNAQGTAIAETTLAGMLDGTRPYAARVLLESATVACAELERVR